jgi:eukaryotic-like serine/threonine-protein kinase
MDAPKSIGRYQIKQWLASGAMGEIYEAHDPIIDRPVAIKLVRRELIERGDSSAWVERFRHEVRAAGRLLHANIVAVLDCGDDNGAPFLAMEFIEGESVDRVLKRAGRLGYDDAIAIAMQTLAALEFAHVNGIVHRDIKPSNILLTKGGLVKVTDFGIAHIEASELTAVGVVLGTPSYMAPEQLAGQAVDRRADLFSAGAVLFELLTGVKPFQGRSIAESMFNMEARGPTDICSLNPQVSAGLKQVIETALAFDRERRYGSAADFARALAAVGGSPARAGAASGGSEEATVLAGAAGYAPTETALSPPAATPLNPQLLDEVERDLAVYLGPFARIAVRRSAKTIPDVEALYDALATYIDKPEDRARFISRGRQRGWGLAGRGTGGTSRTARTGSTISGPAMVVDPALLSRIEGVLTQYVGPIARVLLRQQLSKSTSLSDLYRDLASYIPDERDRTDFLKSNKLS